MLPYVHILMSKLPSTLFSGLFNTRHRPRTSSGGGAAGGSGGGNLLTRRLCRTRRRRDDNELYRSNSFKFERFERKEGVAEGAGTLSKQVRGNVGCLSVDGN